MDSRWNRDPVTGQVRPGPCGSLRPRVGMPLSPRERQVLTLLSKGYRQVDIRERLYLTKGSVQNTIQRARKKLCAASTAEAVEAAERTGQLGPTRQGVAA